MLEGKGKEEMKCSRNMCGVTIMDKIRNDAIREEVGVMGHLSRKGR